jgi:hypothetical protein
MGGWLEPALISIAVAELGEDRAEARLCGILFSKTKELRAREGLTLPTNKDYLRMVREFKSEERRLKEEDSRRRALLMEGVRKVKLCEEEVSKMTQDLLEFEAQYPQLVSTQQRYQLTVEQ